MTRTSVALTWALLVSLACAFSTVWLACAQGGKQERVLFVSDRDSSGKPRIFVMNADGSNQKPLTQGDMVEFDPFWSPDGKRIAFAATPKVEDNWSDLYMMNADGSDRKRLTSHPAGTLAYAPTWSPDGKRICFATARFKKAENTKLDIWVVDADGANLRRLREGMSPAWSPDGNSILVSSFEGADFAGLRVMAPNGTQERLLAKKGAAGPGAWSADGTRILYVTDAGMQHTATCVMNSDGSDSIVLMTTPDMWMPRWSADGKRIIASACDNSDPSILTPTKGAIVVIDVDGKKRKQLTSGEALDMLDGGIWWVFWVVQVRIMEVK